MLVHCSYQTIAPFVSHRIWNHLLRKGFFFSFFLLSKKNKTRCTNRILQYFTKKKKSYFPYASVPGAKKEKASLFSMSQAKCACVLNCNQVSKLGCLECLFQSRCPPLHHLFLFIHTYFLSFFPPFGFGSPGCRRGEHTGWKNRPATLKESACLWREDSAEV